jgi:hypothetical protein
MFTLARKDFISAAFVSDRLGRLHRPVSLTDTALRATTRLLFPSHVYQLLILNKIFFFKWPRQLVEWRENQLSEDHL